MKIQAYIAFVLALVSLATPHPAAAQVDFNAFKDPVTSTGTKTGRTSGPDLEAVQKDVQGGKVTVGGTTYVLAVFSNSGTSPVKVGDIHLYPSSNVSTSIRLNKCAEAPLPAEAQCAVTVAVTGMQLGAWRVEILLDHDGRTRLATAALTGTVEIGATKEDEAVKADVEATPDVLDFGSTASRVPLVRSVLLRNRTSDKVDLTAIQFDVPHQSGLSYKSECPPGLNPGESCVINVTWSPVSKGPAQGVLMVAHSAKSSLTAIDVKGSFDPTSVNSADLYPEAVPDMGLLVADRDDIDFGDGIDSISSITISLVNTGAAPLTLDSVRLAGSDNGITLGTRGCYAGLVLEPVEACPLTVSWVPNRPGSVIDDLQVVHSGARGILVLPIRGKATGTAARETVTIRQGGGTALRNGGKDGEGTAGDFSFGGGETLLPLPVLDRYTVTSHSPTKAVLNGPVGSIVVRDGEDVVLSGVKWAVTIVSSGVILSSENDEYLLVFDRSLRAISKPISTTVATGGSAPAPLPVQNTGLVLPPATPVTVAAPPPLPPTP